MRDDAPDYDEIRQIIIPEGAWVQVERFFNSNGITLGRLPDQLSEGDIPTYILVPTDAALREAAQQIAAEEGLQDEPDPDPWMSPTDIAAELSVSRVYAGRLLRTGEIPGVVNTGSGERARLRVRRSDLLAWLDTRAVKETP